MRSEINIETAHRERRSTILLLLGIDDNEQTRQPGDPGGFQELISWGGSGHAGPGWSFNQLVMAAGYFEQQGSVGGGR